FEMPGLIFERFESLLLVIWIMQLFATFSVSFYAASLWLSQISKKESRPMMYGLLPVMYLIAMTPQNVTARGDVFNRDDAPKCKCCIFSRCPEWPFCSRIIGQRSWFLIIRIVNAYEDTFAICLFHPTYVSCSFALAFTLACGRKNTS
ncbi:GerAB/ArcD/ProY family transporter, partial [Bacillus paralicheniformis]|uniref:GerAB/ArcD/ProY family transporter n=1 Tax=Bacillus paralicheniformis TaxID=1648923 RepID=UPI00237C942C